MSQKTKVNKFLAGAVTATMVATAVVPTAALAAEGGFTDTKGYDQATLNELDKAVNLKFVRGFEDGTFKPADFVTRGQVVKILANGVVREAGSASVAAYAETNKLEDKVEQFTDVSKKHDAELYYASLIVKDAKIFDGFQGKLSPYDNITREQMAKVLVNAFDLKATDEGKEVTDLNTANEEHRANIQILVDNGVTKVEQFNPKQPVKRIQMASFVVRAYEAVNGSTETPGVADGITSVKAINDTTVEVNFKNAIDKDFIREAEQNGKYFAIYKYGETIRGAINQSETVSFSEDGKSAEFVLENGIQSGERYYVALLDGPDAKVAKEVHKYGPTELRESAKQPDFEVSAVSDKIYIDFSEKMKNSALEVENYKIYDNGGKLIGDLSTFVKEEEKGSWVNAITKTKVEFTLDPEADQKLRAGETYQIKLTTNLETDKNNTLNKDKLVIKVKTPSVKEAAPKVTQARVADDKTIVLVFDKDVNEVQLGNLQNLVDIQTTTGKRVNTDSIKGEIKEGRPNEVVLTLDPSKDADKLDRGTTYKVGVPANIVNNAVFPNAANEAVTDIRATAQDNKAIASLKASLVADAKDRESANLVLTFDQRPTLESIEEAVKNEDIIIKDGGDTYKYATGNVVVKYDGNDKTGKTVIVEGVTKTFGEDADANSLFAPKSNETYTVEVLAGSVKVDAFGGEGVANQEKLKSTINGVSVTAPVLDKITLESADKMVITFKEDIDSSIDLNKITVAGFEADQNKFYSAKNLKGKSYLKGSVSGKTLTLTTAKDGVKFATGNKVGNLQNLVKFEEDAIVSKGSNLSMKDRTVEFGDVDEGKLDGVKFVDNAAPIILFAEEASNKDIKFTFSENISLEGDVAPQFRTGGSAAKSSVGKEDTASVSENTVTVEFTDAWKDDATDELDVTVDYRTGSTTYIYDKFGNKVKSIKLTGVKANSDAPTKPTDPEDKEVDKTALNKAIENAEKADKEGKTPESVKALEEAIANAKKVAADKDATKAQVDNAIKAVEDAVKNLKDEEKPGEDKVTLEGIPFTIAPNDIQQSVNVTVAKKDMPEGKKYIVYQGEKYEFLENPFNKNNVMATILAQLTKEEIEKLELQ